MNTQSNYGVTDRGYAWIIPVACCLINAVTFGIYRSYSLVYRSLIEAFSITRSEATWPISLCMTVIHLSGPISGLLNSYFSVRTIVFSGCLIATIGISLCYFAKTISEIIIFIGIIQGFGIGMTYVQNPAIINQYFVKFRATANGIAMAGGTVGAFILSPLVERTLGLFELRENFLILACISVINLPVCLLLKPMNETIKVEKKKKVAKFMSISPVYLISCRIGDSEKPIAGPIIPPYENNFVRRESLYTKPVKDAIDDVSKKVVNMVLTMERKMSTCPQNIPAQLQENEKTDDRNQMQIMMSIIMNPHFILVCVTHMAYFWGSLTYMMVIVDHAVDKKINKSDAVTLITSFAGGDLAGRLFSGWFMDNQIFKTKYLALFSVMTLGVLLRLTPLISTTLGFTAISIGLGVISGIVVILLNILYCQYLGTEKAPLAFGLSCFFCGAVALVRPMVVGYFRDRRDGSYDGLFDLLSLLCFASGALWLIEGFLTKKNKLVAEINVDEQIKI